MTDFGAAAVSIQQIAQVIQDQNLAARKSAREDRQVARDADIAAQQKAADEIRRAAVFGLISTVVSSGMAIVGGALQMRGSYKALEVQTKAAAPQQQQTQLTDKASPVKDPTTLAMEQKMRIAEAEPIARGFADRGMASGQIATESGKIAGAALNIGGAQAEAEKAEQLAESAKMRTRAEDETDFIRAYADNVRAVQEKLAALQQAEADSMRQILRG